MLTSWASKLRTPNQITGIVVDSSATFSLKSAKIVYRIITMQGGKVPVCSVEFDH
jgi:hypothetical protein